MPRTVLCTVRSDVLHPNISEQEPTPAKPPLPFELQKRAYRVILAVIVRTRADSEVQDPFDQAPYHHHYFAQKGGKIVPEVAGLSKMQGWGACSRSILCSKNGTRQK